MPLTSFRAFKICFGLYIAIYWFEVFPFLDNFLHMNQSSLHPNSYWLFLQNHNLATIGFLSIVLSGIGLIFDKFTRISALWLLINWTIVYHFMPFIFFPPNGTFIGWLYLWFIFYPNSEISKQQKMGWWFILTLGYLISGIAKLTSEFWATGQFVHYLTLSAIVKNPFKFINQYPLITKMMTYFIFLLELLAIFAIFSKIGKTIIWICFMIMHLTVLLCFNIPEIGLFFLIFNLALIDDIIDDSNVLFKI